MIAALLDGPSNVTLRKVRHGNRVAGGWPVGVTFTGILVAQPRVGEQLAILRATPNERILTSPVLRILWGDNRCAYVETEHSVYRVSFG